MIMLKKQKQKPSTTISNLFFTLIDYLDMDSPVSMCLFVYVCRTHTLQNSCAGGGKPARVCICVTYHRTHIEVEENLLMFSSILSFFSFLLLSLPSFPFFLSWPN